MNADLELARRANVVYQTALKHADSDPWLAVVRFLRAHFDPEPSSRTEHGQGTVGE